MAFETRALPGELSWSIRVGNLAVSGNGLPPSDKRSPIGVHIVGPDWNALLSADGKVCGLGLTEEEWDELVARVASARAQSRKNHVLTYEERGRAVGWDGEADIYLCRCGLRTEAALGVVPATCAAVQ